MRSKRQINKDLGQAIKEYLVILTIFIVLASILISFGPSKTESISIISDQNIEEETPKPSSLIVIYF
jgi:hypothetical protein